MSQSIIDSIKQNIAELTAEIASCRKDGPTLNVLTAKLSVAEAELLRLLYIKEGDKDGEQVASREIELGLQQWQNALGKWKSIIPGDTILIACEKGLLFSPLRQTKALCFNLARGLIQEQRIILE